MRPTRARRAGVRVARCLLDLSSKSFLCHASSRRGRRSVGWLLTARTIQVADPLVRMHGGIDYVVAGPSCDRVRNAWPVTRVVWPGGETGALSNFT